VTGLCGYALSFEVEHHFSIWHLLGFLTGLSALSAGSFALNQAQEWGIDKKMPRTQGRPIPAGTVTVRIATTLGFAFVIFGLILLSRVSPLAMSLGGLTAILYNVFYTMVWKPNWVFAAVPGAIPGAMPVIIGYAANSDQIFAPEPLYMFMIMFLWQMPHFWSLAIRFKEDYRLGGIPVLPAALGVERALFHIGLYIFVYVALALASPWFFDLKFTYLLVVAPFALKVLWEFVKYFKTRGEGRWFPFFMWVNASLLVFIMAPVIQKWATFFLSR
jgi:protoheme IX farnesyltransferase